MFRIALVVSHPIQHFCPQYASFSKDKSIEFKVYFASALGKEKYYDANFKMEIAWSNLYLDQFDHHFLNGDQVLQSNRELDAPSLEMELQNYEPDLLIVYGYFQKLQRRAYRWAFNNGVKLAYISDSELRHKRNFLKEYLKYFYITKHFSKIDYFLTVGNANEDFYKYYGVPSASMIRMHFPIDLQLYEKSFQLRGSLRNEIRLKYVISGNECVISVVGKLVPWKNQDHLIDVLYLLENEDISLHVFVIGSGEMMEVWRAKASKLKRSKVHFVGFVDSGDLPAFYAATDIYVHPASVEPHSIAVSEAIYMGCPVIVSDRCGSYGETDDVQEGKNGCVFKFGDIDSLAEKICLLVNDAAMRSRFGQYSRQLGLQFQERAHHGIVEKLIKNLIVAKSDAV